MTLSRRSLFGTAAAVLATRGAMAQTETPAPVVVPVVNGPFLLPPLQYAADANEPHIDARTMTVHHDRHHAAYVANLNTLAAANPGLRDQPLQDILANLDRLPADIRTAVRNNGGGHANHTMFWSIMGGHGGGPAGAVRAAFERDLGGLDKARTDFNRLGTAQFGSGWVFVTVDRAGTLALTARPNQDTPLMEGGRVLMGNDVWEHAYYLKYQNRRADYLDAWWNVVNWDAVAERYTAAMAGRLTV